MKLIVDEQVQGSKSEFQTEAELKEAVLESVDERVMEVIIKKRAPEGGPSQGCATSME